MILKNEIRVIHVMKDGTVRDSIEGVMITCDQFYRVLDGIMEKRRKAASKGAEVHKDSQERRVCT